MSHAKSQGKNLGEKIYSKLENTYSNVFRCYTLHNFQPTEGYTRILHMKLVPIPVHKNVTFSFP